jgi:hypothetical protein
VTSPVEFICAEEADTDGYGIIFAFTNDRLGVPIHHTVSNISAMVQRFEPQVKRVLVLGSFPSSDMPCGTAARTDFDARRAGVKAACGDYWLDPVHGLFHDRPGIHGHGPDRLRSDGIHLTQAAKDRLATRVAQAFEDRGWIKPSSDRRHATWHASSKSPQP